MESLSSFSDIQNRELQSETTAEQHKTTRIQYKLVFVCSDIVKYQISYWQRQSREDYEGKRQR